MEFRKQQTLTFSDINRKRICLNVRSLHCDSFLLLVTLGVSDGQFDLNSVELNPS